MEVLLRNLRIPHSTCMCFDGHGPRIRAYVLFQPQAATPTRISQSFTPHTRSSAAVRRISHSSTARRISAKRCSDRMLFTSAVAIQKACWLCGANRISLACSGRLGIQVWLSQESAQERFAGSSRALPIPGLTICIRFPAWVGSQARAVRIMMARLIDARQYAN